MKCGTSLAQKNNIWLLKAVNRRSRRTVAWVVGGRAAATFQRLYDKVKHLTECLFYTDDWHAFAKILPPERHVIGKAHTIAIEQDHSNTRHHLGRMTRRTKVVSKKAQMIYNSIKLWCALTTAAIFQQFQEAFLSIFM